MIYDPLVWFNPAYMIDCGIKARQHFESIGEKLSSDMNKALGESFAVSVMSLGVNQLLDMQLRVQLVDPKDRSPDLRVMHEVPMADTSKFDLKMNYWDVEVVTLEEHSNVQVDQFIKDTKLKASKKSYDKDTIILCYIDKDISDGKLWKDVSAELQKLKVPNNIFLVGKTHPTKPIYDVARVNPVFDSIIRFDVMEEAKKKYDKPEGTLFTGVRDRKTPREQKAGINPFLED
ncbi:MAG: hypothetical protein WC549_08135 [Actinomycetota bacterium]